MNTHRGAEAHPRTEARGPWGGWLRECALDVLALVWPTQCVGCGHPDRDLCRRCRDQVRGAGTSPLAVTGLGVPCWAAAHYAGPERQTLLAYKHRGAYGFRRLLGGRLRAPLAALRAAASPDGPPVVLVPVPSRPQRVRERGWRHVDALVRVAARQCGLPSVQWRALRTLRGRTGQVGLSILERQRNARRIAVRAGYAWRLRGRLVILVDDIVTTGATVRGAVEAIERAGGHVLGVAALCVAQRRDTPQ